MSWDISFTVTADEKKNNSVVKRMGGKTTINKVIIK